MYKKLQSGKIVSNKATRQTYFRMERKEDGSDPYYGIVDVATVQDVTYVLLENNSMGEEDLIVIRLPKNPYWIHPENPMSRYHNGEHEAMFIPHKFFVCDTWDDLETTLWDNLDEINSKDEIIFWTDEEINN